MIPLFTDWFCSQEWNSLWPWDVFALRLVLTHNFLSYLGFISLQTVAVSTCSMHSDAETNQGPAKQSLSLFAFHLSYFNKASLALSSVFLTGLSCSKWFSKSFIPSLRTRFIHEKSSLWHCLLRFFFSPVFCICSWLHVPPIPFCVCLFHSDFKKSPKVADE